MIKITWLDHGREPQCAPDPDFPDGVMTKRIPNDAAWREDMFPKVMQ